MSKKILQRWLFISYKMFIIVAGVGLLLLGIQFYSQDITKSLMLIGGGMVMVWEFFRGITGQDDADDRLLWGKLAIIILLGVGIRWLIDLFPFNDLPTSPFPNFVSFGYCP